VQKHDGHQKGPCCDTQVTLLVMIESSIPPILDEKLRRHEFTNACMVTPAKVMMRPGGACPRDPTLIMLALLARSARAGTLPRRVLAML